MRFLSILIGLVPFSLGASSDGGTGTISGTVRDLTGTPVAGAAVDVRNPQGRSVYSTLSTKTGDYAVPQLQAGNYAITVKMIGMKPYAHAYLSLGNGASIREDVTLEVDENPASALVDDPPTFGAPIRRASKDFYADDGELELIGPRLSLGGKELQLPRNMESVKGNVVWVYVPGHGRYLLSLKPHSDLGLSLAGQVSGTSLWLELKDQQIQIETDERIAPGSATYNLYALHQSGWQPPTTNASAGVLLGSSF